MGIRTDDKGTHVLSKLEYEICDYGVHSPTSISRFTADTGLRDALTTWFGSPDAA